MQELQQQTYGVDILQIMDATSSMAPVIDAKQQAIGFYPKLLAALGAKGKNVGRFLGGGLVYRDVYCDGDRAFEQSPSSSCRRSRPRTRRTCARLSRSAAGMNRRAVR